MKKKKNVTPRAVAAPKHAAKPNPFELKGSKRKFDVMGKRDKDGKKNIIKSREEAVNKLGVPVPGQLQQSQHQHGW